MPRVVCTMQGGYSGMSEPGGGGVVVTVQEGAEVDVSAAKLAQLDDDFPGMFVPVDGDGPAPVERRVRKQRETRDA